MHISGRVRILRIRHVRTSPGAPKRMPGERAAPTHQDFSEFARVCSRTFAFFRNSAGMHAARPVAGKPGGGPEKNSVRLSVGLRSKHCAC